jgi:protocatechuate 3,4-dioxygenase beta subunit
VNVRSPVVILGVLVAVALLCAGAVIFFLWPSSPPVLEAAHSPAMPPVSAPVAAPVRSQAEPAAPTTGSLALAVVDLDGDPVPGALVELLGRSAVSALRTDGGGVVVFRAVPPGAWKIRIQANRFSMLTEGPVEVLAGEQGEFEARLEPLRALLGQVLDPDGNGVDGAQVELWPEGAPGAITTARTRNAGQFLVTGLEAGSYMVRATHPQFAASTTQRAIAGAREKLRVELGESGEILGTVVTPDGETLSSYRVTIERFVPEVGIDGLEARNYRPRKAAHGLFLLTNLAPGRYDLRVDPPGYGPGSVQDVRVRSGQRTDGVTIEVSAGATVRGSVHDQDSGEPIAGAEVRVSDSAVWGRNLPRERVRTDEDGEFLLEGLSPGRRAVRVRARGYVTSIETVEGLRDGQTTNLDVVLEANPTDGPPQVQFFGIGAVLKTNPDGTVAVKELMKGGPGSRFGLKAGDTILAVDGRDAGTMGVGRVVEAIRGEEGSAVVILVQRRGDPTPIEVSVDRGQVRYDARPH